MKTFLTKNGGSKNWFPMAKKKNEYLTICSLELGSSELRSNSCFPPNLQQESLLLHRTHVHCHEQRPTDVDLYEKLLEF